MTREIRKADGKTVYEPPRLTVISLRPEEAVLGHCKSTTSGGPAQTGSCFPFCNSSIGS
jgi:hypothetical protein